MIKKLTFNQSFKSQEEVALHKAIQINDTEIAVYNINRSLVNLAPYFIFGMIDKKISRKQM